MSAAYRLSHWRCIDTFVYFSHHLVTVPPAGWVKAAHLHGVKVSIWLRAMYRQRTHPWQVHQNGGMLVARCWGPSSLNGTPARQHVASCLRQRRLPNTAPTSLRPLLHGTASRAG
jgi:Glycosyl hydrolase family 85